MPSDGGQFPSVLMILQLNSRALFKLSKSRGGENRRAETSPQEHPAPEHLPTEGGPHWSCNLLEPSPNPCKNCWPGGLLSVSLPAMS